MNDSQQNILKQTVIYVKQTLQNAESGHDWWHIFRVHQTAKQIAKKEHADLFIVELAALLHDIADSKFNNGDELIGPETAARFLQSLAVDQNIIEHVKKIITNVSFKGGKEAKSFSSPELSVVQDADRLDAIGAIGIARTFNYGGYKNRELYNPNLPPNPDQSKEEYKNNTAPTINHFYEKLLLLKDLMNTSTGREMAERRHAFMEQFLAEFYHDWSGEL